MSTLISIGITIIILGLLIFFHELGHFLVAKRVGIKVQEFALGMGPIVFSKQVGETLYSLRALPIGGFNRMAGMDPNEEYDPRGFNTRTVAQRMGVIAAGSFMNFLLAMILFALFFMGIGVAGNKILEVLDHSPAQIAGIQPGDRILAVDGIQTPTWEKLTNSIRAKPGEEIILTIDRDQEQLELSLLAETDPVEGVGYIGIRPALEKRGLLQSIWLGITSSVALIVFILKQLFLMVKGAVPAEVAGPVGMVQLVGEFAEFGLGAIIQFAAMLSLNLGIINLFPIPALDGSRLIFLAVEGLRGQPVNPDRENFIHFLGFVLLIGLMLLITYQDVWRIIFK